MASPHPDDVAAITDALLSNADTTSCLRTLLALKASRGLALADVVSSVSEALAELEVPAHTRVAWLEGLAEIEYRLSAGANEAVQTGAVVGVVRTGVDLMDVKAGAG